MLARVDLVAGLNSIPLARFNGTWWRAVPHHLLKGPPPGAPQGSPVLAPMLVRREARD
jgi:hypothetical protein